MYKNVGVLFFPVVCTLRDFEHTLRALAGSLWNDLCFVGTVIRVCGTDHFIVLKNCGYVYVLFAMGGGINKLATNTNN